MVPEENRWMRWPADVLLDSEYQWAVVRAFNKCKSILDFRIKDVTDLANFFPLDEWVYKAEYADPLVQFLRVNCDTIVAKARESKRGRDPPTLKSIRRQWAQSKVILRLVRRRETMVSHISLRPNGQSLCTEKQALRRYLDVLRLRKSVQIIAYRRGKEQRSDGRGSEV